MNKPHKIQQMTKDFLKREAVKILIKKKAVLYSFWT